MEATQRKDMRYSRSILCMIALFAATFIAYGAKKITIKTIPENATISIDGQEVGTGTYQVKFDKSNEFYVVSISAPGHITRKYRLMKDNPKNTIVYTLPESEAYSASSSGEESGIQPNAWFDIICRKGLSEDMIWKRMMNIATTYFENIEVRDKTAGWLKSGWVYNKFKYETVRTRLEIRLSFTDENVLSYRARIVSEIKDNDCSSSDCYVKYGRTMHRFDPIVLELQTSVGGGE